MMASERVPEELRTAMWRGFDAVLTGEDHGDLLRIEALCDVVNRAIDDYDHRIVPAAAGTCGSCRWWVNTDGGNFGVCYRFYCARDEGEAFCEDQHVQVQYVMTREDFGCVLHEPRREDYT